MHPRQELLLKKVSKIASKVRAHWRNAWDDGYEGVRLDPDVSYNPTRKVTELIQDIKSELDALSRNHKKMTVFPEYSSRVLDKKLEALFYEVGAATGENQFGTKQASERWKADD